MIETFIGMNAGPLNKIIDVAERLGADILPGLAAGVRSAVLLFEGTWIDYASGGQIPGAGFKISSGGGGAGSYANSIQKDFQGPYRAKVWTDAPHAIGLEEGTKEIDLKPFFAKSPKANQSDEGGWFITIPFRHDPKKAAAALKISQKALRTKLKNMLTVTGYKYNQGQGNVVAVVPGKGAARRKYAKGASRLSTDVGRLNGMVRARGIVNKAGREQSAGYITFRRASDKSPESGPGSWKIPPRKPKPIHHWAVKNTKKEMNRMILNGLLSDMGTAKRV